MTYEEQIMQWAGGVSIHVDGQCCPDFSCCQDKYCASPEERVLFRDRRELRDQMLIGFLGAALGAAYGRTDIHVAGSIEGTT